MHYSSRWVRSMCMRSLRLLGWSNVPDIVTSRLSLLDSLVCPGNIQKVHLIWGLPHHHALLLWPRCLSVAHTVLHPLPQVEALKAQALKQHNEGRRGAGGCPATAMSYLEALAGY
jgi:hypothetical protein